LDRQKNFPVFVSVVDDELDLALLFRDALSQIPGIDVFAFSDPLLALEHYRVNHERYGCVISDYRMPSMNGIQLLTKIKEINPEVTGMLISAFQIDDDTFKNCECFDTFLQKPVSMKNLIGKVQQYLGNRLKIKSNENP
jgi:response regulator RpfG family c-di-GMP phosphodiesterase